MILTDDISRLDVGLGEAAGVSMHHSDHSDKDERFEELKQEIERIKEEEPEIGEAVGSILLTNWADGRIEKFFNSKTEDTISDYSQRVVIYYKECSRHVSAFENQEEPEWDYLLAMLRKWANGFLRRKKVPFQADWLQIANDCANDAAVRLLHVHFPYDVHYESWACRVVQNVCYNYIRQHAGKIESVDLDLSEIEEWLRTTNNLGGMGLAEKNMDLMGAIQKLSSEDRKRFIILYYFEGKSFREIAKILNRTTNALYKLHFDALENLRKILGDEGDNKV